MNRIMVLESSIVINTVHMANVAHEWMNLCHVITHVIMIVEHLFTSSTFVNFTAVECALVIFTVLTGSFLACFCYWGHSKGSRRAWCPNFLRSSLAVRVTRGGQLGKSMLHPLVLPQPLFRDRFEVTLVTWKHIGGNFHFISVVHCWRFVPLLQIFLSPLSISPKGGGACLLLGILASFLSPGVQGEGEVRTDDQGEVEGLALAGQCLAKIHALGGQGGVNITHCSHFDFTSELIKLSGFCKTCCCSSETDPWKSALLKLHM